MRLISGGPISRNNVAADRSIDGQQRHPQRQPATYRWRRFHQTRSAATTVAQHQPEAHPRAQTHRPRVPPQQEVVQVVGALQVSGVRVRLHRLETCRTAVAGAHVQRSVPLRSLTGRSRIAFAAQARDGIESLSGHGRGYRDYMHGD